MNQFQKKGFLNEQITLSFLQKHGYSLVFKNKKIENVEIDLLLKKENTLYLIEVKSDNVWRTQHPLSSTQKSRLHDTALKISERCQCSVRLILAIVKKNQEVKLFPLDSFPFEECLG